MPARQNWVGDRNWDKGMSHYRCGATKSHGRVGRRDLLMLIKVKSDNCTTSSSTGGTKRPATNRKGLSLT